MNFCGFSTTPIELELIDMQPLPVRTRLARPALSCSLVRTLVLISAALFWPSSLLDVSSGSN
jgi:hypothetical protein